MTPEQLFHELLGLGRQWRVTRCEFTLEDGLVRLWIEETPRVVDTRKHQRRAGGELLRSCGTSEKLTWVGQEGAEALLTRYEPQ